MEDGRKSFSFQMQIGLTRDQINVDGDLSLASLKDIACSFVDRKVRFFCNVYVCAILYCVGMICVYTAEVYTHIKT